MRLSDQRYEDIKIAIANFLEDYKKQLEIISKSKETVVSEPNMNFILVSEYGANGDNPELIIYKRR